MLLVSLPMLGQLKDCVFLLTKTVVYTRVSSLQKHFETLGGRGQATHEWGIRIRQIAPDFLRPPHQVKKAYQLTPIQ